MRVLQDYEKKIMKEPAFRWWVNHVIKKKERLVSKVKSKYWKRTHKFGIKIPKNVDEAKRFDQENGDHLWWNAICEEMKNVRIAFEEREGPMPPGYHHIKCHMIFDVKMGENFRRKARLVAGGHTTEVPSTLTYSSVVSRDSVRIALTIAALNDLQVRACDIQNAYLTAPCREKIYTTAGPEFGSDAGKRMLVVRALYGLKTAGASYRSFFAEALRDLGFRPSYADPDVWMKPALKANGDTYWEYVLCYVDDVLAIHEDPRITLGLIMKKKFKLKNDKMDEPEMYLGAELSKMDNEDGDTCWSMSSDKYCSAMVANVEETLSRQGLRLPSQRQCQTPLSSGYKPELDCTCELKADGVQRYQEIIGSLRWAIELGRLDILLETSLLSSHLAIPREGHLE